MDFGPWRRSRRRRGALLYDRGVLQPYGRDGAPRKISERVSRLCGGVLQRQALGHAVRVADRQPAARRRADRGGRARCARPELRLGVCQRMARPPVWAERVQLGRLSRSQRQRHPVRAGTVANTFMLRDPEKSVMRSPFRSRPRPAWFAGHKNSEQMQRSLAYLWANPSPATLTRTFAAALRP